MEGTGPERYAVVSCHVERLLDDEIWPRYRRLLERRPGGFPVVSLLRPPDPAFGEDERRWLERAREAARLGPLGHHVHWTAPDHARPTGGDPAERVRREGAWLREHGLRPSLFCGGGWYTDGEVAEACAALGYVDCTPRAERPAYLDDGAPWARLDAPRRLSLPSGKQLATLPTTHSVGALARALRTAAGPRERVVHVYFHDTDLRDRRRRLALAAVLRLLRLRRPPADAVTLANAVKDAPLAWATVARPGGPESEAA
jgi:hypothetical protein